MRKQVFRLYFILLSIILIICACCHQADKNVLPEKELHLIEETIISSIGWAKNKDLELLYSVIANDSCYLEVHPSGRMVKGFAEFRKGEDVWMHPDFRAIRFETRNMHINLSQSGTVAWWYCELDDINEWKGQPASWENTRWTGVLEKRNGKWVIVQMHFSFAAE